MKLFFRVTVVVLLSVVSLAVGCTGENKQKPTDTGGSVDKSHFPAEELVGLSLEDIPDTRLVNQSQTPFDFAQLTGRPTVISFIYTRCPMATMCPLITRKMKKVQSHFQSDTTPEINLVTITFDPGYDTPGVLKSYATTRDVSLKNWDFVTGPEAVVETVVSTFKISTKTVEDGQVIHNLRTYLADDKGRIQKWYRGSEWDVGTIVTALKKLGNQKRP